MTLESIRKWQAAARPNPDADALRVSLGVHLEEIAEMLDTLAANPTAERSFIDLKIYVKGFAEGLKRGEVTMGITDRKEFLDSLADQVVTAVGVGHCANMDVPAACERVDNSNWTKAVDGKFIRDTHGKIMKPTSYVPPDLEGLY